MSNAAITNTFGLGWVPWKNISDAYSATYLATNTHHRRDDHKTSPALGGWPNSRSTAEVRVGSGWSPRRGDGDAKSAQ